MTSQQQNWAGNLNYSAENYYFPSSIADIQDIVSHSEKVKGLGSRHSFNSVADTQGDIISLKKMNRILDINPDKRTVTVQGGITYGQLCEPLNQAGFALHNLASLPHISVVGACMTGTHGSGVTNGNLATSVSAMQFVTANGEIVSKSRHEHGNEFGGMVVSLGGLGIVTQITLDIVPRFDMRQDIYLNMPLAQLYENFDAIQSSAYSVCLFTHWQDDQLSQVWLKSKVDATPSIEIDNEFFGATRAHIPCSPVGDTRTARCTEQLGVVGAWYDRLPHFRLNFTPSHGDELQSEYFVPREYAIEAIQLVTQLRDRISPLLYVTEIRTIAADDLWMSPCYQQDCIAIHFTWKSDWEGVQQVLSLIEDSLDPFAVRPHWGKLFTMSRERVQSRYSQHPNFHQLLSQYDPRGKFRNTFLNRIV